MKSGTNFDFDTMNFNLPSVGTNLIHFGTAQNDQRNELTISAWHVLDEIWDELLLIFSGYVFPFPFGTAQNDQRNELTISALHVFDEIWDELLLIFRRYVFPFPFGTAQYDHASYKPNSCFDYLHVLGNGPSQCYLAATDGRSFCFIFRIPDYLI
jgi:hypothetical protein